MPTTVDRPPIRPPRVSRMYHFDPLLTDSGTYGGTLKRKLVIASVPSKVPDPPAASGKAPRIGTVMAGLGDMIGGGSRTVPGPP